MVYYSKYEHYKKKVNKKKIFMDIFFIYIIAVFCVIFFNALVLQAYKVPSNSMEPQIIENTKIIVNKFIVGPKIPFFEKRIFNGITKLKRGDTIVFFSHEYITRNKFYRFLSSLVYMLSFSSIELEKIFEPNGEDENIYIKRVIGVPGDFIKYELVDNKIVVYINNIPEKKLVNHDYSLIEETEANSLLLKQMILKSDYKVKEGEFYVLGDNRIASSDSRIWGAVSSSQIIGKAIFKYYPLSCFGVLK